MARPAAPRLPMARYRTWMYAAPVILGCFLFAQSVVWDYLNNPEYKSAQIPGEVPTEKGFDNLLQTSGEVGSLSSPATMVSEPHKDQVAEALLAEPTPASEPQKDPVDEAIVTAPTPPSSPVDSQTVDPPQELREVGAHQADTELKQQNAAIEPIVPEPHGIVTEQEAKFVIIVMGWKRHASLGRLLQSLKETDYVGDVVDLDIKIDGGSGADWDKSIQVANDFGWSQGRKRVLVSEENKGLAHAWFSAWNPPSEDHHAIFLEDDIEVSPVWYRWIKLMYKEYGHLPYMAGASLQHQTLRATDGGKESIKNNNEPFGYKLLGSWGFSPHPKHWKEFLALDRNTVNPDVKGLITSSWFKAVKKGSMWTQYFIWFSEKHNLYTVHLNPGDKLTLAANFREKGEHYKKTEGRDFDLVPQWNPAWDSPPKKLALYGWNCKAVSTPSARLL
mmetsp:Transcript_5391/g.10826  ORF Transcript_5391/g.10826 Transcript_5391/m.10826 type:complete len:446 (+) Transcript_5391:77-1414(+)